MSLTDLHRYLSRVLLLCLAVALLAACAARPPITDETPEALFQQRLAMLEELRGWEAQGRIGLRTQDDNVALSLDWFEQGEDNWRLNLRGPLASGSLRLEGDGDGVTLRTSDGVRDSADAAQALLNRHTGYDFPVDILRDWLVGRPSRDHDAEVELDEIGRPESIRQAGWQVDYSAYRGMDLLDMPTRMDVSGPGLRVRIVISEWSLQYE
ncbi:outer membrane lipoprotein LolB [Natronocella acetinitrilica]|uniref:Outer-membrane lipoprotein LolB n=1 Tax=Natronocella acetinitrilica TaxID=414046 RepID=A0AAE3K9R1_9GAMM|nr:lipoprotein insertase outer membrane protein LolB [Natronocella acetinitrilica]MCP1672950.1 outer membrane lipoprotein LolB [Natronocella acetinitrilica]